uniref:uncharacterized protein LOC122601481 n=1 Tax=Erigeron canadensis TaxID=72917 RepID=UPI001CB9BC90|nr:uncharacterized protein LOC122601481 [Erigeron canadensis]
MAPRRTRNVNDVHEQDLEQRIMGRMEERLDRFAGDLMERINVIMNQPRRRNRDRPEEEEENPFGGGSDRSSSDDEPEPNQRGNNNRWESGIRTSIPEFGGDTLNPENFIDWLAVVEEVFEFKGVPDDKKVSLITTRLCGRASAWWQQMKLTRERVGKSKVRTWEKMKKCMRANFIPHNYRRLMYQRLQNLKQGSKSVEDYTTEFYQLIARNDIQETEEQLVSRYIGGLRVQIMDFVNMFDPVTLSEAHQRALVYEKQNRRVGGSSFGVSEGSSGSGPSSSRFVPNQAKQSGGNTAPVSKGASTSGLKCFNCGDSGHRQSECRNPKKKNLYVEPDDWEDDGDEADENYEEAPVFDDGDEYEEVEVAGDVGVRSCDNLVSDEAVKKLSLKTENHPKPYKLQWLKKGGEVTVSKRSLVSFSIGKQYKDDVWCDVVPMDACHLLLGRPWEYDRNVEHNGQKNTYSFLFDNVKITLLPSKLKVVANKPTGTLLTLSQFEHERTQIRTCVFNETFG